MLPSAKFQREYLLLVCWYNLHLFWKLIFCYRLLWDGSVFYSHLLVMFHFFFLHRWITIFKQSLVMCKDLPGKFKIWFTDFSVATHSSTVLCHINRRTIVFLPLYTSLILEKKEVIIYPFISSAWQDQKLQDILQGWNGEGSERKLGWGSEQGDEMVCGDQRKWDEPVTICRWYSSY